VERKISNGPACWWKQAGCQDVIEPLVKKTIRFAWSSLRLEEQS
jgi:hypothetical protein